MSLYLNNGSSETINVCLLHYDAGCSAVGGQPWKKTAWWVISPGQTIIPGTFYNVDLTTVNRYAGIYAFSASGKFDWQGSGNAWFEVSNGVHFDQCGEDENNTPKWVDFEVVSFGASNVVAYLSAGVNLNGPITGVATDSPRILLHVYMGQFYIYGAGFIPGSTVSIVYNYVSDGSVTTDSGDPYTAVVDAYGQIARYVPVSTLLNPGSLYVQAIDNNWGLTAAASANF
jgi:hypothetical protein